MSNLHPAIERVTDRIIERSRASRLAYEELMREEGDRHQDRNTALPCSNLAHGFAATGEDKASIAAQRGPNIGIISAYNDTISSHQPFGAYPPQMKIFAREVGATAQVAGCTPAMCDGVTQGQDGMELSLFSRDVIAQATAVSLSHAMYDCVAMLGMCDKIVPGLLIGGLRFGWLPTLFISAGAMPTGIANKEKQRVDPRRAAGERGEELSCARRVHLLRHSEFQPDDAGADGPANSRPGLHQSRHTAAAGADARRRSPARRHHTRWQ
jgi:phosphogluconate dehydratase